MSETNILSWTKCPFAIIKGVEVESSLLAAYTHASVHSPDPSTQLGAVLAARRGDKTFTMVGNNGPSRGIQLSDELLNNRNLKLTAFVHAEQAAILSAASAGFQCRGATLFVPWYACIDCAKNIVGAGIIRVVGHKQMMEKTPEHWRASINAGLSILTIAGVECCLFDGPVGPSGDDGVTVRFNGETWKPGEILEIVNGNNG